MKSFVTTLGKIFLVIAVNLVIAEGLVRVVHSIYPLERPPQLEDKTTLEWIEGRDNPLDGEHRLYIYKPGSTGSTYGHPIRINGFGFRGAEFVSRNSGEAIHGFRILVLGDSLSMGQGVAEEERYSNVLEAQLRAHYSAFPIEVVNLGVQGFETVQEEKILYRMWDIVRPDLTVVQFYLNDTNITYQHYMAYRPQIPSKLRPYIERLLLFRVIEPWYDRPYRWLNNIPTYGEVQLRSRKVDSRDWKLFAKSVEHIGRWILDHSGQAPFVLFLTDDPGKRDDFYWNVRHTFENNGFIWVDPEITQYRPVSQFEFHPNATMHRAYADVLSNAIIASQRIQATPRLVH